MGEQVSISEKETSKLIYKDEKTLGLELFRQKAQQKSWRGKLWSNQVQANIPELCVNEMKLDKQRS